MMTGSSWATGKWQEDLPPRVSSSGWITLFSTFRLPVHLTYAVLVIILPILCIVEIVAMIFDLRPPFCFFNLENVVQVIKLYSAMNFHWPCAFGYACVSDYIVLMCSCYCDTAVFFSLIVSPMLSSLSQPHSCAVLPPLQPSLWCRFTRRSSKNTKCMT